MQKEVIYISEIRLKTSVTYKGTGSQTQYDFPFDYLRKSFIKVTIDDVLQDTSDYIVDNRSILFNTAPAADSIIVIYRETDTERLVSWADASVLKASDMTISQVQQLHILEEGQDWSKLNSLYLDETDNSWEGNNHKIKNVSYPVNDNDVVTKGYMESVQGGFVMTNTTLKDEATKQAGIATTKASEASTSASAAATSETNAATSETNAASSADMAKRWAEASDSPDNTTSKSAKTWVSEAAASASAAKASETNAKSSETKAANSATTATEKAGIATTKASEASASASAAKNSETNAQNAAIAAKTSETNAKNYSENVNVFLPSVSDSGVLSWTNRAGLANPASVNIKGAKGDKGDTGAQGIQGVKGDKGATGAPGAAASIRIGNVVTGEPGTDVVVTNRGTSSAAILDFQIPRGTPGADGGVTVDTALSATSTNPVQNRVIKEALDGKLSKTEIAAAALKDGAGNNIVDTYAKKTDISGVVKSVNGVQPDTNGNVAINVSGGGGVSTSESNTWTGKQTFQKMKFNFESYNAHRISGNIDNPSSSVAVYNVQGNFTLDMSVLAGLLSNSDATLFTAYITANGAYTLSITNAGTLKYVGNASDLAITVNGLLLNILLIKSSSGALSSVVQASALS